MKDLKPFFRLLTIAGLFVMIVGLRWRADRHAREINAAYVSLHSLQDEILYLRSVASNHAWQMNERVIPIMEHYEQAFAKVLLMMRHTNVIIIEVSTNLPAWPDGRPQDRPADPRPGRKA